MKKLSSQSEIAIKNAAPICAAMITSFITENPYWTIPILCVIGLYGVFIDADQDNLNESFQFILENPGTFTKEIVETSEFKQGFAITMVEFLKTRSKRKKEIIKRIFLGFTSNKDKEKFKLEKLYFTLANISLDGIEYLKFVTDHILELQKNKCKEEDKKLLERAIPYYDSDLHEINFFKRNPVTQFIKNNLDNQFGINNETAKKNYYHINDEHDRINIMDKDMKRELNKMDERISEFISLGIWKTILQDHGMGSVGGGYMSSEADFTDFGLEFLTFIGND